MKISTIRNTILAVIAFSLATPHLSAQVQEEVLRTGDQINLKISGVPQKDIVEISGLYTVAGDGSIRMTHIKSEIKAAGRRPSDLAKIIETAYRQAQIFTSPRIHINVDGGTTALRFVSVAGEVKGTGDVPYRPDLTLLAAVSARGGFTDYADVKNVRLIRGTKTTKHDMKAISRNPSLDVKLRPGDKIIVAQRSALPGFLRRNK